MLTDEIKIMTYDYELTLADLKKKHKKMQNHRNFPHAVYTCIRRPLGVIKRVRTLSPLLLSSPLDRPQPPVGCA